jgi:hypothetical protein
MPPKPMSQASAERLARAQTQTNYDWVRMINAHWGRNVARIKKTKRLGPDGDEVLIETIESDQPWHKGFPSP